MTEQLILKKKNKILTAEAITEYITRYRPTVIDNYDYNSGYLSGILNNRGQQELNELLTGYLLLGMRLAQEENIKVKTKKITTNSRKEVSYLG